MDHAEQFLSKLEAAAEKGLLAAAEEYRDEVRRTLSRDATSEDDASQPGQTPKKHTGELADSIEVLQDPVRVVAKAPHALPLELGSDEMAPRPFLRPTLRRAKDKLGKVALETIKREMG